MPFCTRLVIESEKTLTLDMRPWEHIEGLFIGKNKLGFYGVELMTG